MNLTKEKTKLRKLLEKNLADDSERESFVFRSEGVIFVGTEVFLGNRVYILPDKRLEESAKSKTLDVLANGILARLRANHSMVPQPQYSVRDIALERLDVVTEMLARIVGEDGAAEILAGLDVPEGLDPVAETRMKTRLLLDEIAATAKEAACEGQ